MVVKRSDTEVSQLFPASIQGRQDIEIRPQVQGKIVSVNVSEGQEVKRGQALFVIDPVPFRAALAQASAQVRAAMASSATARLNYESRKRLFDQKVVSKHDLLLAYNSWLDAQAQVSLARFRGKCPQQSVLHRCEESRQRRCWRAAVPPRSLGGA